ncbi:penicillin-binding protein 1A [Prosthecobacter fusiformis]|uniref:Penicillin-binding protein 1A n=1 Tax=Prosthecobacter fusiformis TaxID=48464 RepID=A0A4R7RYI5_9BACT|nr:transglycosylase domain-containing protein [Prosthecobacter fusiformis]TDU71014.1 penicillin-binding protein 1A [Prosthecobacter fusiformis]
MFGKDSETKPQKNWRGESGLKLPFYRRVWFSALMALIILIGLAGLGTYSIIVAPLHVKAQTYDLEEIRKLEAASIIYDRNGEELSRIYVLNRTPVPIKDVPQHFIDALTAQEDSRFFQHDGVDYIGLTRAVLENLKAGRTTQGASTITQQLARQTFGLMEKDYKRKIVEAFVAQRIEKKFSKPEILELYLNRIFFGKNFYGIQAASLGYFGKDAKDLSVDEAATIAGLIKSPNNIEPIRHPERAVKERNYVLERMVIEGTLKRDEAERLKLKPMVTTPQTSDPRLSYVFDEVRQEVVSLVGEERASIGGFQIYTSIDRDLQKAAEEAMKKRLAEVETRAGYPHQTYTQFRGILGDWFGLKTKGLLTADMPRPVPEYLQGAAIVMDNTDGSILAMVGGRDFIDSQYNRATDGVRPVGTAFTPFVYAAAFSKPGYFPMTPLADEPLDNRRVMIGGLTGILGEWGMEVADPKWSRNPISAREALVGSHNSATVRLGERIGLEGGRVRQDFRDFAKSAGIRTPLREFPSTFLGATEARLDEMCLAYSCFPTLGKRPAKQHLIQRITDFRGKTVFQLDEKTLQPVRAMDEIAAYQTHTCLSEALHRGTGATSIEYGLGDFPAGGKTGTHYESKDLWFLGYTSAVTCGVWVGFDRQKTIYPGAFSNQIALPIWTDVINASTKVRTPQEITPPESAERIEVCRVSGLRATDFCYDKIKGSDGVERSVRSTYFEFLRPGTSFNNTCPVHTGEGLPADLAAFHQAITHTTDTALLAGSSKFVNIEPVHLQDPIIIGDDPYNSEKPVLRARPVNDDGTPILRAVPVGVDEGGFSEQPVIKLKPPPTMKIEL